MREILELRIPEDLARQYLPRDIGETIGDIVLVREVVVEPGDAVFGVIRETELALKRKGQFLLTSVRQCRHYSKQELDSAELLTLVIDPMFEPAGEQCGTLYDDSEACPLCLAPRRQASDLRLDLRAIPKSKGAAVSIARNELVFKDELCQAISRAALSGIEFRPVLHCKPPVRRAAPLVWWQPWLTSHPVPAAAQTKFGTSIFADECQQDEYRCPNGPVVGLQLLSELYLTRAEWDGSDFVRTREYIGVRRGLLNPHQIVAVSQRARMIIESTRPKGIAFEVAHLVS